MPPSRFNRTSWPDDGPHREFLEFLDAVHRRHGCRSLRDIGRAMHLSYTRVHDIVRGVSLPVDEAQVRALVTGLTGTADSEAEETATHATELFVKARRARDEADPARSDAGAEVVASPAPAADPPAPRPGPRPARRTLVALAVGAVLLAVLAVALVVPRLTDPPATADAAARSASPAPAPSGASSPSPAPAAAPDAAADAAPGAAPDAAPLAASMQVTAENPGGCSPSYLVDVTADSSDPRIVDHRLWIVSELYADMGRSDPNDLYFAKTPVVLSGGRFSARIEGNTQPGVRTERYLLVASPSDAAHADLQLSLSSDRAHDDQYPDYRRTTLQLGNTELATGPDLVQRC